MAWVKIGPMPAMANNPERARYSPLLPAPISGNVWRMWVDIFFLIVTGAVAYHGLTYRDENGESEWGHLLFGAIALLFFFRVLFVDVFKLI